MSTSSLNDEHSASTADFFAAIEKGDAEAVRELLTKDRSLTSHKMKSANFKYDQEYELDAYKFLGAYLGATTGLQLAILKEQDIIALDIIDATLQAEDLNLTCGGGNTALHLATFMSASEVIRKLLERCDPSISNSKNFKALDIADDVEVRSLFQ